jgi:ligand-binding SRPBCC domain-containing protein
MAQYKVQAPDGQVITLEGPDGASQEEVIAQAQILYKPTEKQPLPDVRSETMAETGGGAAVGMPRRGRAAEVQPTTPLEAAAQGVFKGAVLNPALAVTQVVGGEGGRNYVKGIQEQYAKARKDAGLSGFDIPEMLGAVVSPINRLFPAVSSTSGAVRAGQYAGQGAVLGALTPAQDSENILNEKLQQMAVGGALGGALSGAIDLGKGVYTAGREIYRPLTRKGQESILRDNLNEMAGEARPEILNALKTAKEIVPGSKPTMAEALADIPAATSLAAFQKSLEKNPKQGISASFAVRNADVANARKALIKQTAGSQDDLIDAIAQRTRATAPLREAALSQANVAGELAPQFESQIAQKFTSKAKSLQAAGLLQTEAAQQQQLARNFFPVPGYPRVGPELSNNFDRVLGNLEGAKTAKNIAGQRQAEIEFKKLQLQSLAENGFYPLRVSPIIDNIDNVLSKPGERASDVVVGVFSSLKDKLQRLSNPETGVIDSNDLYTIRKEIGNDIKKFSEASQNWDAKLTGGLEKTVKSYIDNAIEKAGNSGDWKRYLDAFQKESTKINQIQIAQALEKQLGTPLGNAERVAGFAAALENAPNLIKRSTGQARFQKLDDILTKQQMADFNSVLADVQREAKGDALAKLSNVDGQTLAELPNLLNRYAMVTNFVLKVLKKDVTDDINKMAATMSQNPPMIAAFMEGVPKGKAETVVKALWSKLTPENQAALSRALIIRPAVQQATEGE